VKKERVRRLMLAQAAISRTNLKKLIGRKLTVLVDALTDNRQGRQERQGDEPDRAEFREQVPECRTDASAQITRTLEHSSTGALSATGNSLCVGRTRWDAPEIDGVVKLSGRTVRPGRFITALVTHSSTHDITAKIL
jgi:tRNA A37 methylthiotransferase MiaB